MEEANKEKLDAGNSLLYLLSNSALNFIFSGADEIGTLWHVTHEILGGARETNLLK